MKREVWWNDVHIPLVSCNKEKKKKRKSTFFEIKKEKKKKRRFLEDPVMEFICRTVDS